MSTPNKGLVSGKIRGSAFLNILVGLPLMVIGMALSRAEPPAFLKALAEQGIPIDLGMVIAVVGVLIMLFPAIASFFIQPLQQAIEARNSELEKAFGSAESLRDEMTQMRADYERRLAQTEAEAREQIQAQVREAQQLRQTLTAEAAAKADQMVARAQEEIEREKHRALTDIRLHVVDLTLKATETLLGENVDDARNRRLVQEFVDKVEVPG